LIVISPPDGVGDADDLAHPPPAGGKRQAAVWPLIARITARPHPACNTTAIPSPGRSNPLKLKSGPGRGLPIAGSTESTAGYERHPEIAADAAML
jgi:hypothetical protein